MSAEQQISGHSDPPPVSEAPPEPPPVALSRVSARLPHPVSAGEHYAPEAATSLVGQRTHLTGIGSGLRTPVTIVDATVDDDGLLVTFEGQAGALAIALGQDGTSSVGPFSVG